MSHDFQANFNDNREINLGAIQVLLNALGGGRESDFPEKNR